MSRYEDNGEGEVFPGQFQLFQANVERALRGKRGRQALADLREALLNLPEKRLIEGALCTVNPERRKRPEVGPAKVWAEMLNYDLAEHVEIEGEGVCAVGAYAWWKKVKAGADPVEAFDSLPTLLESQEPIDSTARVGNEAGLAMTLAYELAFRSDEVYGGLTPEERYQKFLDWLNEQLEEAK